jgi:hypothetical protein
MFKSRLDYYGMGLDYQQIFWCLFEGLPLVHKWQRDSWPLMRQRLTISISATSQRCPIVTWAETTVPTTGQLSQRFLGKRKLLIESFVKERNEDGHVNVYQVIGVEY